VSDDIITRFIDHYKDNSVNTTYKAGRVCSQGKQYIIGYEQYGAHEAFSVGQPVYDRDKNLMGYLGICLFDALDYCVDSKERLRIPVEVWSVCLPTKHCEVGKEVFTYWQMKEGESNE